MHLDLVTPEHQLLSEDVVSIEIPGMEGDMTIVGEHAPLVTTLRPGLVVVKTPGDTSEYLVTGGFAEISATGVSILAEQAVQKSDVTTDMLDKVLVDAKAAAEAATDLESTAANMRVNDLTELMRNISA